MTIKWVLRLDKGQRKFRLLRFLWRRGVVGDGDGYSAKLSVSLVAKPWGWTDELYGWRATFLGLQLHHLKAYGGIIV